MVAAEINGERRSREYVVFNIRVHDNTHEWTVLRRFRNFEQLHKQLRNTYKYGGSLPPKRYIFASHKWEFVEERREQLDVYLKDIIHKVRARIPVDASWPTRCYQAPSPSPPLLRRYLLPAAPPWPVVRVVVAVTGIGHAAATTLPPYRQ